MKKLLSLLLLTLPALTFAQHINQRAFNYAYKGVYSDTSTRIPSLNSNRAFYNDLDSVGQLWFRPDSVKLFGRFPGNVIKTLVTYDTILAVKNQTSINFIQNQNQAPQTADYAVSGVGSVTRMTTFNTAGIPFVRYYSLGHHGVDTLQQRWSFGMSGTPLASGPPNNGGDSLTIRSYTTTGAVANDVMTFYRGGGVRVPLGITVGRLGFGGTPLVVNGNGITTGNLSIGGTLIVSAGTIQAGSVAQNNTSTPTTDYTALSTDLYINVNNTANCTITIPAPIFGTGSGRILYIKKISANGATVTITPVSGTIEGNSTLVISTAGENKFLHDDGLNWFVY